MNLRHLFSSRTSQVNTPEAQACPAGHPLDPSWQGECPYCKGVEESGRKSAMNPGAMPPIVASGREPRIDPPSPPGGSGRETRIDPGAGSAGVDRSPPDTRRITGVLVTFSWRPSANSSRSTKAAT